jgi:hypothetical protein
MRAFFDHYQIYRRAGWSVWRSLRMAWEWYDD